MECCTRFTISTVSLVENVFVSFNRHYADTMATDFDKLSLQEQVAYVKLLYKVSQHEGVTIQGGLMQVRLVRFMG